MLAAWMQARTYPDLLKSPHDEELFEHYCQSNLIYIKVRYCPDACTWLIEEDLLYSLLLDTPAHAKTLSTLA